MSARTISETVRHASNTLIAVRHASTTALPVESTPALPLRRSKKKPKVEHGRQIFVFNHLQKNNVVYSLTRALKNNDSLRQIPFNGKKTVPAALRKDLWHPFALISFPPGRGSVGLSVYQKLREYRRRHELEWGDEIMKDENGKFVNKSKRGRKLCDQKANSVADMATVLGRLSLKETAAESEGKGDKIGLQGEGTGEMVEVLWRDLHDAEFAETWGDNVEHGLMDTHTNNRTFLKIWGLKRVLLEKKEQKLREERRAIEEQARLKAERLAEGARQRMEYKAMKAAKASGAGSGKDVL